MIARCYIRVKIPGISPAMAMHTFNEKKRKKKTRVACAQRKLYFHFLSHWMGYDRGDSFRLDFEPNGIPFGSKSKGNLSPRSYPIQCERKWDYSFLSVWVKSVLLYIINWRRARLEYSLSGIREAYVCQHNWGPLRPLRTILPWCSRGISRPTTISDGCTDDSCTLKKINSWFPSNWKEYDHSHSFPFDYEPK